MDASDERPWYRRTLRWGQTNLTELDPARYDPVWHRAYWRRTRVQGIIVNAGGIVAYYPSTHPLHRRARYLGDRDLYGEIVAAAHADGRAVLARMDSNRADARFYVEHPDWFAVDRTGTPYREGELFVACVNSPYYEEYLPAVLREIIARSRPEGVTDNSWSGLDRARICYCRWCAERFRAATGLALPERADWASATYRRWITWSYDCRLTVWDRNNRVTREAGGPDCLWIGMNSGDVIGQARRFRDYREICRRAELIMLDSQARGAAGFQANGAAGRLIHGLLGWDKLLPESTAMYQAGRPTFRVASKPEAEAQLWALDGFAGGIQPWWHHIGAYQEDRRQYRTAEPLFRWHEAHQEFLVDRTPIATVGVVWSQRNIDFYGRDEPEERVALPQRGVLNALLRARIPYLMLHADDLAAVDPALRLLILPNLAALSAEQGAAVRRFVARGGGLLATGETSRYDEWGDPRPDFALADLVGAHATGAQHGAARPDERAWDAWARHTYLRLAPERRAAVDGPHTGDEPPAEGERHPALRGFEATDLLPFGGRLDVVTAEPGTVVPLTYVPPFPIYPPETAWMRQPATQVPALIVRELAGGGRVAYLPADLDRRYAVDQLPDHATLLANLVRWAAREPLPLEVAGPGLLDCALYRQPGRLVLHLVNLSGTQGGPVEEVLPVGPLRVRLRLPADVPGRRARLLVAAREAPMSAADGWATLDVASVADHEVAVVE